MPALIAVPTPANVLCQSFSSSLCSSDILNRSFSWLSDRRRIDWHIRLGRLIHREGNLKYFLREVNVHHGLLARHDGIDKVLCRTIEALDPVHRHLETGGLGASVKHHRRQVQHLASATRNPDRTLGTNNLEELVHGVIPAADIHLIRQAIVDGAQTIVVLESPRRRAGGLDSKVVGLGDDAVDALEVAYSPHGRCILVDTVVVELSTWIKICVPAPLHRIWREREIVPRRSLIPNNRANPDKIRLTENIGVQ